MKKISMKAITKERGSIFCNQGAWEALSHRLKSLDVSKIFVLCDQNTITHCLPLFLNNCQLTEEPEVLIMPSGESYKNIETCAVLWQELSNNKADRKSLLINLGGGVVTDLGGFVASTFKRGIEFINIPTTLLAMVDASVGGKNGVDLGAIKNQIGVIRNPDMVLIDTQFLETLPSAQIKSGMAEMLKHGLIKSMDYWAKVKDFKLEDSLLVEELIWTSVLIKNEIVSQDPFEKNIRKTLNYGHTLGHAIESYCLETDDKETLLHGEAIAIGMILANYISHKLFAFPEEILIESTAYILSQYQKQNFSKKDIEAIISLLIFDKKNQNGKVLFVLLSNIGVYKTDCQVPDPLIYDAFKFYLEFN